MNRIIIWLREKLGIYMLNAHIDGVKAWMNKIKRLKNQKQK